MTPADRIRRFHLMEVALHWALAVPYMLLLVTGVVRLISRTLALNVVPETGLSLVHRIAGCALLIDLVLVVCGALLLGRFHELLGAFRECLSWTRADLKWLFSALASLS